MAKETIVATLTPEQELLIPVYREKWIPIAYSTAPPKMLFDLNNHLHSDRGSALEFPDGYSVYAHHGRHPNYII